MDGDSDFNKGGDSDFDKSNDDFNKSYEDPREIPSADDMRKIAMNSIDKSIEKLLHGLLKEAQRTALNGELSMNAILAQGGHYGKEPWSLGLSTQLPPEEQGRGMGIMPTGENRKGITPAEKETLLSELKSRGYRVNCKDRVAEEIANHHMERMSLWAWDRNGTLLVGVPKSGSEMYYHLGIGW